MEMTIKSKILNESFTFTAPISGGYIWLETKLGPKQICSGGGFAGSTISTSDNKTAFKNKCRKWYKQYLSHMRDCF